MRRINRTKLFISYFTMSFIISGIIIAAWSTPAISAPKVYKLRMQTIHPASTAESRVNLPDFIDRVKKMSNGRLDITLYTAGQLVPTLEIIKGLKMGMIDLSYGAGMNFQGTIPEAWLELATLPPGLLKNNLDFYEVYWNRGVDDILREGYAEHGVHYIRSLPVSESMTYWTKDRVDSVEDLKGLKVRSYAYASEIFKKMGATPVFIPHEEVYTALAQGTIDSSFTGGSLYEQLKYYEVAPYYNQPGLYRIFGMHVIASQKLWNELPDDLKAILDTAVMALAIEVDNIHHQNEKDMIRRSEELGFEVVNWPEKEMAKIMEVSYSLLPEVSQRSPRVAKGLQIIIEYMKEREYMK
jgi:TRAP-type mannitol/chloroaromatic compound transport system substrate-binding protein